MHCKMSSAICFNFDQSKILSSGNGLKKYCLVNFCISEAGRRQLAPSHSVFPCFHFIGTSIAPFSTMFLDSLAEGHQGYCHGLVSIMHASVNQCSLIYEVFL